jgi:hypothetical protein
MLFIYMAFFETKQENKCEICAGFKVILAVIIKAGLTPDASRDSGVSC